MLLQLNVGSYRYFDWRPGVLLHSVQSEAISPHSLIFLILNKAKGHDWETETKLLEEVSSSTSKTPRFRTALVGTRGKRSVLMSMLWWMEMYDACVLNSTLIRIYKRNMLGSMHMHTLIRAPPAVSAFYCTSNTTYKIHNHILAHEVPDDELKADHALTTWINHKKFNLQNQFWNRGLVIRERYRVELHILPIENIHMKWYGHLVRMPPGNLPGEVVKACHIGKRPHRIPRTCCRDVSCWLGNSSGFPKSTLLCLEYCLCHQTPDKD